MTQLLTAGQPLSPDWFLSLTPQQKRRLPHDLQILWRLARGLCPVHGTPLIFRDYLNPVEEFDLMLPSQRLIVVGCNKAGCGLRLIARDWNNPAYEDGPYCIERFGGD